LINRWLSPLVPFACHVTVYAARRRVSVKEFSCSVVIPARNEAGNIRELLNRLPQFGSSQEIVFVEGGSSDATWEAIHEESRKCEDRDIVVMKQRGIGKGAAVREALAACSADLVFILDSDLSVDPEALIEFYEMMCLHDVDFINGTRMVYPMEMGAMRPFNWVGNKVFASLMSYLIDRRFSDTLCGTKVFFRDDFVDQDDFLTRLDPFGDFSLLIGAGAQQLRIREQAVSYRSRTYGATNIHRWRDGLRLLRIVIVGLPRVKFVRYAGRGKATEVTST
jgi:glycosyltransferase involved in cell wall biosynthesis